MSERCTWGLACNDPGTVDPDGEGLLCPAHAIQFERNSEILADAIMGVVGEKTDSLTIIPEPPEGE